MRSSDTEESIPRIYFAFTEVTEVLQAIASPEQPTTVSQTNQSKFITATTAPTAPHPEPITFHPTCKLLHINIEKYFDNNCF